MWHDPALRYRDPYAGVGIRKIPLLVLPRHPPYLTPMPPTARLLLAFAPLVLAGPVLAQPRSAHPAGHPAPARSANAPKSVGKFEDWQAATHQEGGTLVCYAFTFASASAPVLPGRGNVVLTVTQRPGSHDAVAISAGFAYPAGSEAQLQVEGTQMPFYTANRSAFARDGRAVVAAFEKARQAVVKSPAPRNVSVSDTFSLRGFTPAYAAVNKACSLR